MSNPITIDQTILWTMDGFNDHIQYFPNTNYRDGNDIVIELEGQDKIDGKAHIVFTVNNFKDFLEYHYKLQTMMNNGQNNGKNISLNWEWVDNINAEKENQSIRVQNNKRKTIPAFRFIIDNEKTVYYRAKPKQLSFIKNKIRFTFIIEGIEVTIAEFEREMEESRQNLQNPQSSEFQWVERFRAIESKEIQNIGKVGYMINPEDFHIYSLNSEGDLVYDVDRCLKKINGFDDKFTDGQFILKNYSKYNQFNMYLDMSIDAWQTCIQQWSLIDVGHKTADIDWHTREKKLQGDIPEESNIVFRSHR